MTATSVRTKHLKILISVLLLFAVLGLSSCGLFKSPNKLATNVRGRVTIEGTTDYSGINVQVRYFDSTVGWYVVLAAMVTDSSGYFAMTDISLPADRTDYKVYAWKSGYANSNRSFSIHDGYDGSPFVFDDMNLHQQKKMVLDWAWKEGDGSSFIGAETGQSTVYSYIAGPSNGQNYCTFGTDTDYDSRLKFYDDDPRGASVDFGLLLCDAGPVPLSSVTHKPDNSECSGCINCLTTIQVGHTYVAETKTGYAKFHVKSLGNAE